MPSALLAAARYAEILELVEGDTFWPYKRWAVKVLVAQGRHADALGYAEECRNPWASDTAIDAVCEQILLSTGDIDDAYARYAYQPECNDGFCEVDDAAGLATVGT